MRARRVGLIPLLVFFALSQAEAAARPKSNEPFTSFRIIDKQLSLIDQRSSLLKSDASPVERNRQLRDIKLAIGRIRGRSSRLTGLYRSRHERFGVKMFTVLDRKAQVVAKSLTAMQQAKNPADRDGALQSFTKATLDLVLQFQAASANYGANHCAPRQWACCEPKLDPETQRDHDNACKWSCVPKPRSCTGFLGPQTLSRVRP